MEEQAVTTSEISRAVSEAAAGAAEIASNVAGAAQGTRDTSSGAASTLTAARDLARTAERLRTLVAQFVVGSGGRPGPGVAAPAATAPVAGAAPA